jgi:hypothetical protein
LTPGVEILANTLHTILRARFYRETPEWMIPLCAMGAASVTILLLTFAGGRFELIKQLGVMTGLVATILLLSYLAFTYGLIVPPLVPALAACLTAAPLAWLRRSLIISADLDARIAELAQAGGNLPPASGEKSSSLEPAPAALIAKLTNADATAIFGDHPAAFQLLASHGAHVHPLAPNKDGLASAVTWRSVAQALAEAEPASQYFSFDGEQVVASGTRLYALADFQLFFSNDQGAKWTPISNNLPGIFSGGIFAGGIFGAPSIRSFVIARDNNLYLALPLFGLYLSRNNGGDWLPINIGLPEPYLLGLEISGSKLFAATATGKLYVRSAM